MKSVVVKIFILITIFSNFGLAQNANVIGGGSKSREILSPEVLDENGKKAAESISSYENFVANNPNPALANAAKATVQLVAKCSIKKTIKGYRIESGKPAFCGSTHPLSKYGQPGGQEIPENMAYPGVDTNATCTSKPCSGVLIKNQSTIATSAHCAHGLTPKQLCEQYVFVFNRTEGQQDSNNGQNFTQDEIFECDGGIKSDTTTNVKNFNLHSDQESRDHAFFNLKRSVPKQTAEAVKVRSTPVSGEDLYAVGHPYGSPRMVSTLRGSRTTPNSNGRYSYIQANGYAYGGNSGGPLIDSNGQLVGILSSTDDKKHGPPVVREPMVKPGAESTTLCRTQITNNIIVESIGIGTEFTSALERVTGPSLYRPEPVQTIAPEPNTQTYENESTTTQ